MADTHVVLFVGGPKHGEVEEREGNVLDAPREIALTTYDTFAETHGRVVYARRAEADTPGRIAYVYDRDETGVGT